MTQTPGSEAFDVEVDFLIVGSGGGSFAAALAVKDAGKTPMVLEKTDKVGGSTAMSGGVLWIPNNPLLKRDGIPDSYERGLEYLAATVGDTASGGKGVTPARTDAYLRTGPEMVEFLEGKGVRFRRFDGWSDYYDDRPGGAPRGRSLGMTLFDTRKLGAWEGRLRRGPFPVPFKRREMHRVSLAKRTWEGRLAALALAFRMMRMRITGKHLVSAGTAIQAQMLDAALRNDIDIRINTGVEDFILSDSAAVIGVVATMHGERRRIGARDGVLLNVGGFARNQAMRDRYHRTSTSTTWTNANPGDTGEMLERAIALGADTDNLDKAVWIPGSLPPGAEVPLMHPQDLAKPYMMLVDVNGDRFCNEAGSYMETGERMHDVAERTGQPSWAILDSRHRNNYVWGKYPPLLTPPSWFEKGYMVKADSLDELAAKIGVDAAGLKRSAERMTRFAKTGVDEDFNKGGRHYDRFGGDASVKPNPCLGAIDRPPFYAVRMFPGDVGTYGGLVTDEDGRVLRPDGRAIPGLYATGNCTASVTGGVYPGAGASIAASFIFGLRAARRAVRSNR